MRYSKFELVMRQAKVHEDSIDYKVSSPNGVKEFARKHMEMHMLPEEHFVTVMVNAKGCVTGYTEISHGLLSSAPVHPREVFKPAVVQNASAVVLVHNHPSGDPRPSEDDIKTTKRLVEAGELLGIKVLDHVIIGYTDSYSFAENGVM